MTKLLDFLARTPVIVFLLVAFVLLGASFYFAEQAVGGPLLDMQMNSADAFSRLEAMSSEQKHRHIIATLTLDTFYPLTFGGLLAGIVARFSAQYRRLLVIPAFVTVIADFAENFVQSLALSGSTNLLVAKDILTPLKFTSFILATIIALLVLIFALAKWTRRKRN